MSVLKVWRDACGGRGEGGGWYGMAEEHEFVGHQVHLIFDWKKVRGSRRRLAGMLLVAAGAHAGMFYLFRVVVPVDGRVVPPRSAMLHLPGEAAETVALVSALEDRFPGMWRRAESGAFERDLELLRGMVPPVFEKHEGGVTVLKPFGLPLVSRGLSAVVGPGQPLLPVLGGGESGGVVAAVEVGEEADGGEEVEAPRAQPSLALESGLDGRAVVTGPGWPERVIDETWPETAAIPFMLGVDAGGRVRYCLPVTPATGVDHEKLRGPLLGMRFAARPGTGVQWVTAAVRW